MATNLVLYQFQRHLSERTDYDHDMETLSAAAFYGEADVYSNKHIYS